MTRYRILASAFLMQMCLGATYAWSVFVQPIRAATDISQGVAQFPFTVFYLAFPTTLLFSGTILRRFGPRASALIGTLLFGTGWITASAGASSFAFVILGVGVLAGVGVGFAYIVPIAVGTRWFPRQPGLVTGIAVAGFGVGAALVSTTAGTLMSVHDMTPFAVLGTMGAAFLVLALPAASVMRFPPGEHAVPPHTIARRELLRSRPFRILFVAMVTGLSAGFAVNSNLKELNPIADAATGVTAVSVFAMANAAGRIAWGWIFDRLRPSAVLRLNLLSQTAVIAGVSFLVHDTPTFIAFAALAGFNYGGMLVLYASTSARRWGVGHVGQVYGLLFTANILAAPAPVLAGFSFDAFGSFIPAFAALAAAMVGAAFLLGKELDRHV